MTVKGRVIYVGQSNGQGVRIGAKSPDGLTWWWTLPKGAKVPRKGDTVVVPQGAKPEPGRRLSEELARESEIARAVALKAAAGLYVGCGKEAERLVIGTAEVFLQWLRRPG